MNEGEGAHTTLLARPRRTSVSTMPDSDASPPGQANTSSGAVHGTLLQARDIHGGVHIHPAPAADPLVDDVCLDPPRPATGIRDRAELLATLESAMAGADPLPHVLVGPGGIGKSTIAAALAERAAAQGRSVFWVRPGSVAASMLEIAVELGGARAEAEPLAEAPRRAARWVWRHLDAAPQPWLLVFDNADRPEELDVE